VKLLIVYYVYEIRFHVIRVLYVNILVHLVHRWSGNPGFISSQIINYTHCVTILARSPEFGH
jgi:hypothetical protein